MARGKIQIKRIQNTTKKANELTVLYDAKVSIIMFSSTGKLHKIEQSTKQFFDQYQMTLGVDIWNSHYENMQENLKKLKEVNRNLRKEFRYNCLNELGMEDLRLLEEGMDKAAKVVRERKRCIAALTCVCGKHKGAATESLNSCVAHMSTPVICSVTDIFSLLKFVGRPYDHEMVDL
eukprot:XP_025982666.1 floral homeotic protein PMADS 1-like [Glycine max]